MLFDVVPYDFLQGLKNWSLVFGSVAGAFLIMALLISLMRHGLSGVSKLFSQVAQLWKDMIFMSPRRVWALAQLTFREAVRRKTLLVFGVFFCLFMFAGWFVSNTNTRPELQVKVHVSFVLQAISWLILPVMLLLSCWGIPADIKARSLHTVVTKPARKNEIFLGRLLGFSLISTLILFVMGGVGYLWIIRQVPKEAQSKLICRVPIYGELLFHDRKGNLRKRGVNVGDEWMHRSFITGATNARAVWTFQNVAPENVLVTDPKSKQKRLVLESRFEAYRTYKGNMERGLGGEIHFINNLREQAAQGLANGSQFPQLQQNLRSGKYHAASVDLERIANGFERYVIRDLPAKVYKGYAEGYRRFSELMRGFREKDADDLPIEEMIVAADRCEKITADAATAIDAAVKKAVKEASDVGDTAIAQFLDEAKEQGVKPNPAGLQLLKSFKRRLILNAAKAASNSAATDYNKELAKGLRTLAKLFDKDADAFEKHLIDRVAKLPRFYVQEFREPQQLFVNPNVTYTENGGDEQKTGDLFELFVHRGELRVSVICTDANQNLGMGTPDLLIRMPDHRFWVGFSKAIFGIWLMTLLVIIFGVTASCFVKGPVATLLTFVLLLLGTVSHDFLQRLAEGKVEGAGTISSAYRLVKHMNPKTKIEGAAGDSVVTGVDSTLNGLLWGVAQIVPDFNNFRVIPYVANGFDIPWNAALLPALMNVIGYFIPCLLLGYYSLTLRELEER